MRHRHDLMLGEIAGLGDARVLLRDSAAPPPTTRLISPTRIATIAESASGPMRSAISTPSSIRLTARSNSRSFADTVG